MCVCFSRTSHSKGPGHIVPRSASRLLPEFPINGDRDRGKSEEGTSAKKQYVDDDDDDEQ